MSKLESIKNSLKFNTYDWMSAVETTSEKIVLLLELGMF